MGSTRLPGKILLPIAGKPLLLRLIERVKAVNTPRTIVVATTVEKEDDPIFNLCYNEKINIFRGHPTNLIDRHFKAALKYNADFVVKIPSDCPLIDPAIIDHVLKYVIKYKDDYDYISNLHPATYPDGNDVEVMSINSLYKAWLFAHQQFELEHTTPYFWENPDKFRIGNVIWETGMDLSMSHRFNIDYIEDYNFIQAVYDELFPIRPIFTLDDILTLLKRKPELMNLNKKYIGVNWYRNHLNELKTITPYQTKYI